MLMQIMQQPAANTELGGREESTRVQRHASAQTQWKLHQKQGKGLPCGRDNWAWLMALAALRGKWQPAEAGGQGRRGLEGASRCPASLLQFPARSAMSMSSSRSLSRSIKASAPASGSIPSASIASIAKGAGGGGTCACCGGGGWPACCCCGELTGALRMLASEAAAGAAAAAVAAAACGAPAGAAGGRMAAAAGCANSHLQI